MKGQELTPLEDWVLEGAEFFRKFEQTELFELVEEFFYYAKLLKSTPKLGDFIPCDEDGNPLSNPKESDEYQWDVIHEQLKNEGYREGSEEEVCKMIEEGKERHLKAYQEAEQRVLWKGEWVVHKDERGVQVRNLDLGNFSLFIGEVKTYSDLTNKGLIFKRDL